MGSATHTLQDVFRYRLVCDVRFHPVLDWITRLDSFTTNAVKERERERERDELTNNIESVSVIKRQLPQ